MTAPVTFRSLEKKQAGGEWQPGSSPLDEWYEAIRDTPIDELSDGNLCRACRQQLYLDAIIPIAVSRLRLDPLAGDMYDGELIASLKAVPSEFWHSSSSEAAAVRSAIAETLRENDDGDLKADIQELVARIPAL
ncbi:MAG: hypothetical protein ISQ06_16100 [Planctomycetaceae bacterium]|nr:hypothetical protein [Planctomycetaceae bacterium]